MNEVPVEFYAMFSYINAHGRRGGDNTEWRWCGPFESRKEASATAKRIQKNGQSRNWYEYCEGPVKVFQGEENFLKKANAVGLHPAIG
jgi:hypothetical protein